MLEEVPETLTLRDYHADNLVWLPGREGVAAVGLLDYQDAVAGRTPYDLMSLLEDARRDLQPGLARLMLDRYLAAFPDQDRRTFEAAYAILAAQRHCKVIGIFTRLAYRDGKLGLPSAHPAGLAAPDGCLPPSRSGPAPRLAGRGGTARFTDGSHAAKAGLNMAEAGRHSLRAAMLLAAGLGLRLRPITEKTPKPLVQVAGRTLIDLCLDRVAASGIGKAVVNTHYLAGQVEAHLKRRPDMEIVISHEPELLDTGGRGRQCPAAPRRRAFSGCEHRFALA